MRVVLLLMLFQFFTPPFFTLVAPEISKVNTAAYHVQQNSMVAPLLLKENDEKENKEFSSISTLAPLLDFTIHTLNLAATHKKKYAYLSNDQRYDLQPSRFTLHCTFLI